MKNLTLAGKYSATDLKSIKLKSTLPRMFTQK